MDHGMDHDMGSSDEVVCKMNMSVSVFLKFI